MPLYCRFARSDFRSNLLIEHSGDHQIHDLLLTSRPCLGFGGKAETESCPWSQIGTGPDSAAMGLDDRPCNRQTHTGPLWFRGVECVEDLFRTLSRESNAGIADRDGQLILGSSSRGNPQLASAVSHGLDRV